MSYIDNARISITISPIVETNLKNKENISQLNSFFKELNNFSKEFKDSIMIWIPYNFKFLIKESKDPYLNIFLVGLQKKDSNIAFSPKQDYCSLYIYNEKNIYGDLELINLLSYYFRNFINPFIVGPNEEVLDKKDCNYDPENCKNFICKDNFAIYIANIFDYENRRQLLIKNCNINLSNWLINNTEKNLSDLRKLMFLSAFFLGVDESCYSIINKVEFLEPELINDIKDINSENLKNFATSITRAVSFPAAETYDSKEIDCRCIDWHINRDYSTYKDFKIFRLDIVPIEFTGYFTNHSGAARVLFAKKKDIDDKYYFFYYTETHDFKNHNEINRRLDLFS